MLKNFYSIGLDIGTNSVGWAVLDENNEIIRFKGKHMWGSRLFDEGKTASGCRGYRSVRRRMDRRRNRINLLQELMKEDVFKIDHNFFERIKESRLYYEDKSDIARVSNRDSILFNNMSDKKYYKEYPTIYHLRKALIENDEKFDIRFIYLAIHHILKYRGHFLYESKEFNVEATKDDISEKVKSILMYINDNLDENLVDEIVEEVIEILKDINIRGIDKNEKITYLLCKLVVKNCASALSKLVLGYSSNLNNLFGFDEVNEKIKNFTFKKEYDENEMSEALGEKYEYLIVLKDIYDWNVLQNLLDNEKSISSAMVKRYDKHKEDLRLLKELFKEYYTNKEYRKFFRNEDSKYNLYINNCKNMDYSMFIKELNQYLDEMDQNDDRVLKIKNDDNFLPKQTSVDNSSIPYQLNKNELVKILDNQGKYYEGIQKNKEKILSILSFKIPYYVGPLNENSKWAWIEKLKDEKIYPWNFEEVVDKDTCAEKFIERMTNTCTYYLGKPVIPQMSLLYSDYCLYNELNKIKINGKRMDSKTKEIIYREIFCKSKNVKDKAFKKKLVELNIATGNSKEIEITGYQKDNEFASSLTSRIDFENIIGNVEQNKEMIEDIIRWLTIFNEKEIIKRKIKQKYPQITDQQIYRILKLNYSGWSRLSRELLEEVWVKEEQTGKEWNIIKRLKETTESFMEVINNKELGFDIKIGEISRIEVKDKIKYQDISDLATSPANKRGIWQTIQIVDEIVKIMKKEPNNICIEFARSDEQHGRVDSRVKMLNRLYENIKQENTDSYKDYQTTAKELGNKIKEKNKIDNDRLFLYFLQNGKCMYSGEPLEIENLSSYQIDHILPQSLIKDDSIDNRVIVKGEMNQYKKDSLVLDYNVREKMQGIWGQLLKMKLMSPKKYYNLMRINFDEGDIECFVNRQIVETRQITKHVANMLNSIYQATKIIPVKAELTSNLRNRCGYIKLRNLNHFHHAQDAYMAVIIGRYIDEKFRGLYIGNNNEAIRELYMNFKNKSDRAEKFGYVAYCLYKNLDNNMSIRADVSMKERIRQIFTFNDCIVTRKLEEGTGEFFNQTIYGLNSKIAKPVIPLKKGLECEKYGGYSGANEAYYCAISAKSKNKNIRKIVGVPIHIASLGRDEKSAIKQYIEQNNNYSDVKILKDKIYKFQVIENSGMLETIVSSSEIKNAKELILSKESQNILHSKVDKVEDEKFNFVYDEIVNKIKNEYKLYSSDVSKLIDNRDKFYNLDKKEKIVILNNLMKPLNFAGSRTDLSKLGGSSNFGRKTGQNLELDNIVFISQSITGLYERRYRI